MAVDDKTVQQLIDDYLARNSTPDELERNRLAFRAIQAFRNGGGDSTDESLAAAEHYLFARYMVSNGVVSERQMKIMVLGYDSVKAAAQVVPAAERAMRHNKDRATSRVSAASIRWGLRGVKDGAGDHASAAPDGIVPAWNWDAMKFGGTTDAIAEFGKKVY